MPTLLVPTFGSALRPRDRHGPEASHALAPLSRTAASHRQTLNKGLRGRRVRVTEGEFFKIAWHIFSKVSYDRSTKVEVMTSQKPSACFQLFNLHVPAPKRRGSPEFHGAASCSKKAAQRQSGGAARKGPKSSYAVLRARIVSADTVSAIAGSTFQALPTTARMPSKEHVLTWMRQEQTITCHCRLHASASASWTAALPQNLDLCRLGHQQVLQASLRRLHPSGQSQDSTWSPHVKAAWKPCVVRQNLKLNWFE